MIVPSALCPSDVLETVSDKAPILAARVRLPAFNNAVAPPASKGIPVTANPLAAATVPTAIVPKCTAPLNKLPHHVLVTIGSL